MTVGAPLKSAFWRRPRRIAAVGPCSAVPPCANSHEIAAWRYLNPEAPQHEIDCAPETFTPWFRIAWPRVILHRALPANPGDVDSIDHARCR
jgi:isopentenyl-diphosphate delta-isomerase